MATLLACLVLTSLSCSCFAQDASPKDVVFLFSSFRGNGESGLHLAYSEDGLNWSPLNHDKPLLAPQVGGKLMRDPCIIAGPDGAFHMVWTTSWTDKGIGIAHSKDLVCWSKQEFLPVMQHEQAARNCWAPEILWEPNGEKYFIYWATTIPGRFPDTAGQGDHNHRIYYTTTNDFEDYSPTKLLYDPGFNVIDSTILTAGGRFVMILKDETRHPLAKNLRVAMSRAIGGPWDTAPKPFSPAGLWVEGPTAAKIGQCWYVYFDAYATHRYGAMRTNDFQQWEDVSDRLHVPEGMRHGTVFAVSRSVLDKLRDDTGS